MINLQNANLRTFAFVEAQMTKGMSRPTEYLLPFFRSIIARNEGNPYDTKETVAQIEVNYGIEVPLYLAESLTNALLRIGALERDENLDCYICKNAVEEQPENDLKDDHFTLLEERLKQYAKQHDIETPLSCETWQQVLINFFSDKDSDKKIAKIHNKFISEPQNRDFWLVSKFIVEGKLLEPDIHQLIKKIYVGYAIAETITAIQHVGHKGDWNNLSVVYDSTVLMRLLGTSGETLKRATLEMHELLLDIGCKTYYFDHNLHEVFHNLEALTERYMSGGSIHRETAQALDQGEITIATINLLKGNADHKLGELNITQLEVPSRLSNTRGQVNPLELEDYLKSRINYKNNSYASQVDAESVEKILFLRKDKKFSEVPKSNFVFITHNGKYARASTQYCKDRLSYHPSHVPPTITLSIITRMAWLASENGEYPDTITKELIISCFQASLPDENWFGKFWKTIENTAPDLLDPNTHDSLYLLDIRKTAEDISLGSGTLLEDINIPEILNNAKQNQLNLQEEHKAALDAERQQFQQTQAELLKEKEEAQRKADLDNKDLQLKLLEAQQKATQDLEAQKHVFELENQRIVDSLVDEKREELLILQGAIASEKVNIDKAKRRLRFLLTLLGLTAFIAYIFLATSYGFENGTANLLFKAAPVGFLLISYLYLVIKEKTFNPEKIYKELIEGYPKRHLERVHNLENQEAKKMTSINNLQNKN